VTNLDRLTLQGSSETVCFKFFWYRLTPTNFIVLGMISQNPIHWNKSTKFRKLKTIYEKKISRIKSTKTKFEKKNIGNNIWKIIWIQNLQEKETYKWIQAIRREDIILHSILYIGRHVNLVASPFYFLFPYPHKTKPYWLILLGFHIEF